MPIVFSAAAHWQRRGLRRRGRSLLLPTWRLWWWQQQAARRSSEAEDPANQQIEDIYIYVIVQ